VRPAEALAIRVEGRDAAAIPSGSQQPDLADRRGRGAGALRWTMPAHRAGHPQRHPIGKGMGSSAAALTTGVVIADRLLDLALEARCASWTKPRAWRATPTT